MPTILQWMRRYNELIRLAQSRGIHRGPTGRPLRELTNIAVPNAEIAARVAALEAHINGGGTSLPTLLPTRHQPARGQSRRQDLASLIAQVTRPAAPPLPAIVTTPGTPTFGIEIECLFPSRLSQAQIARALNSAGIPTEAELYNHSRRGHWKVVTDGSLSSNPGTNPYEIVSPVLTGATGLEQITKVCTTLNSLGAIVNRSCGFHVHVGVSSDLDNVNFFRRLVQLYKQHGPLIERVLAPSRRQGANTYCRDFRFHRPEALDQCRSVSDVINMVNGPDPRSDRYYKLNLNSYFRHRTVEFRQHRGTLDAQKATMWTRFCLKLVAAAAKTTTMVSSDLAGLLVQIEASDDERTYFMARAAHFQQLENQGEI